MAMTRVPDHEGPSGGPTRRAFGVGLAAPATLALLAGAAGVVTRWVKAPCAGLFSRASSFDGAFNRFGDAVPVAGAFVDPACCGSATAPWRGGS